MQRRSFLQSTLATGGIAAMSATAMSAVTTADDVKPKTGREFFELRTYLLKPDKQKHLDDYLKDALIPALNRSGIKQVGVFHETPVPETPAVYLLIPYSSLEQMTTATANLESDAEYQKAAANYLAMPATDPVYERIESSLLRGFETMPKLEAPEKKGRLFNLRMFNKGEIAIFRRVGLTPVLFGEAIVGTRIPNLTYLLAFDDDDARNAAWTRFRTDPEWIKLKAIPEYEDKRIVSKITNKLLTPASYSQI
jgi:hypothetical protein